VQVDGTDLSQGGDNSQIQGVLEAIVTAISDNVASRSSGDSEKDSNSSTNDSDEDANAALEQASAAEVLESLRADIVRSLQVPICTSFSPHVGDSSSGVREHYTIWGLQGRSCCILLAHSQTCIAPCCLLNLIVLQGHLD
jgi:hypothetical protein